MLVIIIIIINIKYGLITLRFMVIFLDLTKNIYQNGKYIYYDGISEILHRYISVLTSIEIFHSNEQTEMESKTVFITLKYWVMLMYL